eukprot:727278-Rhodomonas_salina.1
MSPPLHHFVMDMVEFPEIRCARLQIALANPEGIPGDENIYGVFLKVASTPTTTINNTVIQCGGTRVPCYP